MKERLEKLKSEIENQLTRATSKDALETLRIKYLGRNGELNELFKEIASFSLEEKKLYGYEINTMKLKLTRELKARLDTFARDEKPGTEMLMPGKTGYLGHYHLLSKTFDEIIEFFQNYGFSVATGPEIEYDWYNFEALNMPKNHPARDMQSCLYTTLKDDLLLRSHTSPIQIRVMEKKQPPVKIVCPGRCYRYDQFDASHSPVFHQIEAFYVDENVSFGELKWLLGEFVRHIYGPKIKYELRPSFFPFTEPSGELAISCAICGGEGCAVCGNSGWVEVLGCGMVHPLVLKNVKISPKKYSGYALGMGVERVAIVKYVIDDIRAFYNNDVRFLEQF